MQLIINMPFNELSPPCFNSLMKLTQYLNGFSDVKYFVNQSGGSHVGYTRERLMGFKNFEELISEERKVFEGQHPDYTHILWIDSDIQFSIEDFTHLMDDNQPIVSGYYTIADGKGNACILEEGGEKGKSYMNLTEIESRTELIELSHCGFGFVLIQKGVFETIPSPYFLDQKVEKANITAYVGEDVAFCVKAKAAGFKIWADPRVRVYHYKSFLI